MRVSRSSTTTVRTPCSPRIFARVRPDGPAPTITTSTSLLTALAPQQEVEVQAVECLRVLVLWPVTAARHHLESRAGNHRCDASTLGDVRGRVVAGPHHQRGHSDRLVFGGTEQITCPD